VAERRSALPLRADCQKRPRALWKCGTRTRVSGSPSMPELPEVETVRRGLQPLVEGATIGQVRLQRADLRFPFPEGFRSRLEGRRIEALGRRAKYLLFHLDSGLVLVSHLGMSGSFRIASEEIAGNFH